MVQGSRDHCVMSKYFRSACEGHHAISMMMALTTQASRAVQARHLQYLTRRMVYLSMALATKDLRISTVILYVNKVCSMCRDS
jgi:hypothetical protein